jgi:hypothetical protein
MQMANGIKALKIKNKNKRRRRRRSNCCNNSTV